MTTRVFAYGSISEGMVHFHKLAPFVIHQQRGRIRGKAYRLRVGYPVILKQGVDWIPGQVLELRTSEILQALLDEFFGYNPLQVEGSLYLREQVLVSCEEGPALLASVYFLNQNKLPEQAQVIAGGDWEREIRETPVITEALSEKQKIYIQKLGSAAGRDIIPINDLSLYRDLISLGLIVDKGRRLALSKWGQEVYRYLG